MPGNALTRGLLTMTTAAVLLTACATITPDLPSITDGKTNERHSGKVVWHDLLTNTPEASRKFYGELFGWTFEEPDIELGFGSGDDYMLIRHNGKLIGGMLDTNSIGERDNVSQWITMISVPDVVATVAQVTAEGGSVLTPPRDLASRGVLALVEDPTGAFFALIQTRDGDPGDADPEINGFLWDELWTNDVPKAGSFYTSVLDYQVAEHDIDDTQRVYHVLESAGTPRAGLMSNPFEGARPVWVNYLRVQNPADIAARVESLGGEILVEPQPRDIGGVVAFVAGPSGAGIALQTWPIREGDSE